MQGLRTLIFSRDIMFTLLMCIMWGSMLLGYLRGVVNHLPILSDYTDQVEALVVIVPLFCSLPFLRTRLVLADYVFYLVVAGVYMLNLVVYGDNYTNLVENMYQCLCMAVPFYFWGRMVDIERYYTVFLLISALCVVCDVFYFLSYLQNPKALVELAADTDKMHVAYSLLPHVLFLLWSFLRGFNLWGLLFGLLGTLMLIAYGTRGPLACILFFVVFYFFFFMRFRYAVIVKGIFIVLILIAVLFLDDLLFAFKELLDLFSMSSRIIDKYLSGDLLNDSNRSIIKDILFNAMDNDGGFFGLGLFGSHKYGIIYAHNLVIDLIVSFGYVPGALITLTLFVLVLMAFLVPATDKEREFLLFLIALSIVKLMLSNTFILEPYIYGLIGFCVSLILRRFSSSHRDTRPTDMVPQISQWQQSPVS